MKQARILGAGIAGMTAAITLAKNGYNVTVFEKRDKVGARFNGDIQGLENWSEKKDILAQIGEMGIKANFDCSPFSAVELNDSEKTAQISANKPLFYLIKRGSYKGTLDYGLLQQALKNGVKVKFNRTIPEHKADIVATGPIFKESAAIDKGIVFDTKGKDIASLVFDDRLAFGGYSYLLITKGKGCMCTVVFNEFSRINECFKKAKGYFLRKYKLKIKNPKPAGGIGSFSLKHSLGIRYRSHETLYAGEAAGLQDFLWGFGMRYAMESGYLAAKSIIEGKEYELMARKAFMEKLKASMVNRYIWERLGKKAYSFIIRHPRLAMGMLFSMHNFNLAQRAIFPFAESYLQKKYPKLKI